MEVKYLPTCEVGVPDGWGDVDNCAEPAIAWIKFKEGDGLYICQEHLEEAVKISIEQESEE